MKYIFLFLLIFTNFEIMAKKISELNWQKRLLIVSYENKEDELLIQTKKFIISNNCRVQPRVKFLGLVLKNVCQLLNIC